MNDKFKMLALQAQMGTADFDAGSYYVATPDKMQKFAELIVRECLEACSRANEIRHFVPPTQEQVVLSCMREIETTFRS